MSFQPSTAILSSNAPHSYWTKKFWASFLTYTKNFNSNNPDEFKYEVNKALNDEIQDLTPQDVFRIIRLHVMYLDSMNTDEGGEPNDN